MTGGSISTRRCGRCGAEATHQSDVWCGDCGELLPPGISPVPSSGLAAAPIDRIRSDPPRLGSVPSASTRRCPDCGTEATNPIDVWCPKCSGPLPSSPSAPSSRLASTVAAPSFQRLASADVPATGPNWLGLTAGVGMSIGAVLPWITANLYFSDSNGSSSLVSYSWGGLDPYILDGWYVLTLGGALALIELVALVGGRPARQAQGLLETILAALLLGLAGRFVVAAWAANPSPAASSYRGESLTTFLQGYNNSASVQNVSAGGGLWLLAISAVGLGLAGLWRLASEGS